MGCAECRQRVSFRLPLTRFASMARHCSVEIAAVIVLDHGLRAGTCRAPTTATFAGGLLALDSGADQTYVGGHTHLDRAEDFDLCLLSRPQRASITA